MGGGEGSRSYPIMGVLDREDAERPGSGRHCRLNMKDGADRGLGLATRGSDDRLTLS